MITNIDRDNGLIWFQYKGDEIAWMGSGYYSLLTCSMFLSLEEMDKFWHDYAEDCKNKRINE